MRCVTAVMFTCLVACLAAGADPITLPGAGRATSFADVGSVTAELTPSKLKPGEAATLTITVTPKPGCYTYPLSRRGPGAKSVVELPADSALEIVGDVVNPEGFRDVPSVENPLVTDRHYEDVVTFLVPVRVKPTAPGGAQTVSLAGSRIQVCTDQNCFNTDRKSLPAPAVEILAPAAAVTPVAPVAPAQVAVPPPTEYKVAGVSVADYQQRLTALQGRLTRQSAVVVAGQGGLAGLLTAAILWGLVSLVTPCVFPMIPITVSLFLKQAQQSTGTALKLAAVYSLTIIAVLGSAAVLLLTTFQELSVHEWMNFFLGALFVFFAVGLFGAYEITFPQVMNFLTGFGWVYAGYHLVRWVRTGTPGLEGNGLTAFWVIAAFTLVMTLMQLTGRVAALESRFLQRTEQGRKAGGVVGTVAGAVAFSIISFTCVAPFLGGFAGLLQSGGYSRVELVIAGLAFATAFASPFFVLALFPSLVKQLPKSGGWLDTVKAVMGFLELAAAFKFFRTAEQKLTGAPEAFTYELCLAAWLAIAVAAGLYLLRAYRLPHDDVTPAPVSVGGLLAGVAFLAFAAYIAPGLADRRPNGTVYAWVNAFLLPDSGEAGEDGFRWTGDLPAALESAKRQPGKRVFVDFTGVTCANCKFNEKEVFPRPAVKSLLEQYELVQLYVDTLPPQANSMTRADRDAIAEANLTFQHDAFRDARLPLYVILAPEGDRVRVVGVYEEGKINSPERFAEFLRTGLTE